MLPPPSSIVVKVVSPSVLVSSVKISFPLALDLTLISLALFGVLITNPLVFAASPPAIVTGKQP